MGCTSEPEQGADREAEPGGRESFGSTPFLVLDVRLGLESVAELRNAIFMVAGRVDELNLTVGLIVVLILVVGITVDAGFNAALTTNVGR